MSKYLDIVVDSGCEDQRLVVVGSLFDFGLSRKLRNGAAKLAGSVQARNGLNMWSEKRPVHALARKSKANRCKPSVNRASSSTRRDARGNSARIGFRIGDELGHVHVFAALGPEDVLIAVALQGDHRAVADLEEGRRRLAHHGA